MTFHLQFSISDSLFIATSGKSGISYHHAEQFCTKFYGSLSCIDAYDVERYVNEYCHEDLRVGLAERMMCHLLKCHNVPVGQDDRIRRW